MFKDSESLESLTFAINKDNVIGIHEKLWPFLAAVTSSIERVNIAKDSQRCEKLKHLCTEMVVGFKDTNVILLGTIKFIGNVKGIGKCFGINLHVSFLIIKKYMKFIYIYIYVRRLVVLQILLC